MFDRSSRAVILGESVGLIVENLAKFVIMFNRFSRYNEAHVEQAGFQTIKAGREKIRVHFDLMDI
jgi:hypothetical protein